MRNLFILIFLSVSYFCSAQNDSVNTPKHPGIYVETSNTVIEQEPEFPGGEAAMMKFVAENVEYPEEAKSAGVEGTIRVKFTVTAEGKIKDPLIISKDKLGSGCEQAAIKVILSMPKWKPGRQNGQAVPVYFNLPIRFKLY